MKLRTLYAASVALGVTFAVPASAQQPAPQPPPGQPAPGQPAPGQPAPGQPEAPPNPQPRRQPLPPGAQPGQPQPGRRPPPRPPGGLQPGQQLPPGHPPVPGAQPAPAPAPSHGGGDHGGHCPGHGPMDPPPHINWYQGLLGVNNEKAQSPRFVDRLLWRYKNDKDECDHKNQEPPVLASVINFAVLLFILFKFGKEPVMSALAKRKKDITQDIDSANELKLDAEKRLSTYERQLSRIEERRKELAEEHRLQWELEKKRILDEAQEKSDRLRKDARFRVDQELKQAEADILREAIDGAVIAAEELLKTRVQGADQERLADEYLAGVAASLKSGAAVPSSAAKAAQEKA